MDLKAIKEMAQQKMDSWSNILFGLGVTGRDKRMGMSVTHAVLQQDEVEDLYAGDDIARKVVDKIPHEGIKKGFEVTGIEDANTIKKLGIRTKELALMNKLEKAWGWARLYGGAAILIGVSDGEEDLTKPLDPKAVKKLNSLTVMHRWELSAVTGTIERDLKSPNFGLPNLYQLAGSRMTSTVNQIIHYTRLIRFDGAKLPERKFETNQYWHDSVLTAFNSIVRDFNLAHDTLPNLVSDFRIGILRLKGIADMLAAGKSDAVINRLQSFDLTKSSYKTAVLDEDESYDFKTSSLAGMKDIMDKIDNRLVTATNMPHTIILGKSPTGGLSGKGESENRDFMDLVSEQQNQVALEPIIRILTLLFSEKEGGVTAGNMPDEFGIQFNSLWQMDDKEVAEIHKFQAEADERYLATGVVTPSEVAISRFGKGVYSLETQIDVEAREEVTDSEIDFDIEEEFALMNEVNEICNAIDKGQYTAKELTDNNLNEVRADQKRVLQTIIIMKSIAESEEAAEKIAKKFGKVVTSRETENSWRFRQRTPGDFKKGSFKAFRPKGKQGVILLFGELR